MKSIASRKKRLLAFIWDWVIIFGPMTAVSLLWVMMRLEGFFFSIDLLAGVMGVLIILLLIAGFIWMIAVTIMNLVQVSKTGQSLGKKRIGIQIVNKEDGKQISVLRFLGRNVLTSMVISVLSSMVNIFSIFYLIDYAWVLFDKNNEAIHDKIWKTRVVVKE